MKNLMKKYLSFVMCIAVAISVVSCGREDGGDSNTPLTNESIVGKRLYTNKYYRGGQKMLQSEIRFAADNIAYLTAIETDYVTGEETAGNPLKATYNLTYPDIVFEDKEGNNYAATFIDNGTLVFNGRNIDNLDEELWTMQGKTASRWDDRIKGWHFLTFPQTIAGPYMGQVFKFDTVVDGFSYTISITFGVNFVSFSDGEYGRLVVNYPNFTIDLSVYGEQQQVEGYFVDANTIILFFEGSSITYTRIW